MKRSQKPLLVWGWRYRGGKVYLKERSEIMRLAFGIPDDVTEVMARPC